MKKENRFRDPWAEGQIGHTPDGVLHATVPQGKREKSRPGPEPYSDDEERQICLSCKLPECALDHHKHCKKLIEFYKNRRS